MSDRQELLAEARILSNAPPQAPDRAAWRTLDSIETPLTRRQRKFAAASWFSLTRRSATGSPNHSGWNRAEMGRFPKTDLARRVFWRRCAL